jgi:hypothetical protein
MSLFKQMTILISVIFIIPDYAIGKFQSKQTYYKI